MAAVRTARITLCGSLVVLFGLAFLAPGPAQAQTGTPAQAGTSARTVPAQPTCPSGTSLNSSTGRCEQPAIATCPTGTALSGDKCVTPSVCPAGSTGPDRGTCTDPNAGPRMFRASCPEGSQAIGSSDTCTAPPVFTCPSGWTLHGAICAAPPTLTCPPGATLSGTNCILPPEPAAPVRATTTTVALSRTADDGQSVRAAATGTPPARAPGRHQLAATGSPILHFFVGLAGLAFLGGGLLLLFGAPRLGWTSR